MNPEVIGSGQGDVIADEAMRWGMSLDELMAGRALMMDQSEEKEKEEMVRKRIVEEYGKRMNKPRQMGLLECESMNSSCLKQIDMRMVLTDYIVINVIE